MTAALCETHRCVPATRAPPAMVKSSRPESRRKRGRDERRCRLENVQHVEIARIDGVAAHAAESSTITRRFAGRGTRARLPAARVLPATRQQRSRRAVVVRARAQDLDTHADLRIATSRTRRCRRSHSASASSRPKKPSGDRNTSTKSIHLIRASAEDQAAEAADIRSAARERDRTETLCAISPGSQALLRRRCACVQARPSRLPRSAPAIRLRAETGPAARSRPARSPCRGCRRRSNHCAVDERIVLQAWTIRRIGCAR